MLTTTSPGTHEVPGKYRARDKLREAAQESQERSERRAQRDGEVVWWLCVHVPDLPIQCFECPHMLGYLGSSTTILWPFRSSVLLLNAMPSAGYYGFDLDTVLMLWPFRWLVVLDID